jgi:tetratricopeptide (TPR) repeat protein
MAVAAYEEMIQSASVDSKLKPSLYIYKGRSLAQQGLREEAEETFAALQQSYPDSLEAIRADVEVAKVLQEADPGAAEGHLEKAIESYRQLAAEPQAATGAIGASSGPLQTEGFLGDTPGARLPAQEREIQSVFLIAEAYGYLERYDRAIETLEELKNKFPHDARVFQAVTGLTQMIRREQEEKAKIDAKEGQALSTAPAAVGAVSQG